MYSVNDSHSMGSATGFGHSPVPLATAIAIALDECGIGLLANPRRLASYVMDIADPETPPVKVFLWNCDEVFLSPFIEATTQASTQALVHAANQAKLFLQEERFIMGNIADEVIRAVCAGIAHRIGVSLPDAFGTVEFFYDTVVLCKECEEATGERTPDSVIADELACRLASIGIRVFYPRHALASQACEHHDDAITDALATARTLLILSTSARNTSSPWLRQRWMTYFQAHANERARIIPCIVGYPTEELPQELIGLWTCRFDDTSSIAQLVPHIRAFASLPLEAPKDAHGSRWLYVDRIRLRTEGAIIENTPIKALFLMLASTKCADITITLELPDGKQSTMKVPDLFIGEEILLTYSPYGTIASIKCQMKDYHRPASFSLRWTPVEIRQNQLVLRIENSSGDRTKLGHIDLVTTDSPRRIMTFEVPGFVEAKKGRNLLLELSAWDARTLRKCQGYDIYLNGKKLLQA